MKAAHACKCRVTAACEACAQVSPHSVTCGQRLMERLGEDDGGRAWIEAENEEQT